MSSREFYIDIFPRDPIIARDGRPFSFGQRMRSLSWVYPSVFAGAFRTLIGEQAGGFDAGGSQLVGDLLAIATAGPFPAVADGENLELCLPAPLDLIVHRGQGGSILVSPLRPIDPFGTGTGCDTLPGFGLWPCMPQSDVDESKPEPAPAWWSASRLTEWLAGTTGHQLVVSGHNWPAGYFETPVADRRIHAAIHPETGVARDSQLFVTTGLALDQLPRASNSPENWSANPACRLVGRVSLPVDGRLARFVDGLDTWAPIGGERRLAEWRSRPTPDPSWKAPNAIRRALGSAHPTGHPRIRMFLATPALFDKGWLPAWLSEKAVSSGGRALIGKPPGTDVTVRLAGACIGRWHPISGWSHESGGTKPVRRLVPTGSVYFFEVEGGDAAALADRWLQPVSDLPQDRADGFGLALWGTW